MDMCGTTTAGRLLPLIDFESYNNGFDPEHLLMNWHSFSLLLKLLVFWGELMLFSPQSYQQISKQRIGWQESPKGQKPDTSGASRC